MVIAESQNVIIWRPQLNGISWRSPAFPLLTQPEMVNERSYCSERRPPTDCINRQCFCPQVLEVENGQLVEVVIADPGNIILPSDISFCKFLLLQLDPIQSATHSICTALLSGLLGRNFLIVTRLWPILDKLLKGVM